MNYIIKVFHDINEEIRSLREEVFVKEQGFSVEVEINDNEYDYTHICLYNDNNELIAYSRFIKEEDYIHLGRILVKKEYRLHGIGSILLMESEKIIKNLKEHLIILHSQYQAVPFYEKNGYVKCSEMFLEDNYPHYSMKKDL